MEFTKEQQEYIDTYYQLLPLDADGVPIRVGDELVYINECGHEFGCIVTPLVTYDPTCYRHIKPRTLEDVLHEMLDRNGDGVGLREFNRDFDAFVEHYADEIRAMFGEVDR